MRYAISAVEAIDGPGFGAATVALLFRYEDRVEAEFLEEWASIGEELLVADADPAPHRSR